jgi:hypothetical protein
LSILLSITSFNLKLSQSLTIFDAWNQSTPKSTKENYNIINIIIDTAVHDKNNAIAKHLFKKIINAKKR